MRVSALGSLAALAALAACSPMDKGQGLNQFDTKSFWCSGWACGGGSGDGDNSDPTDTNGGNSAPAASTGDGS